MGRPAWIVGLLAAAIVSAGCGGGEETSSAEPDARETGAIEASAEQGPAKAKKGAWGVVFGAEGDLGIILYDLSGHTLYTFSKDRAGTPSCYGPCAKRWPPALTEGRPEGRGTVQAALVGATKRNDGTRQLTYAGHPLYTFSEDGSADTGGNGVTAFGGEWYAIRPNGEKP